MNAKEIVELLEKESDDGFIVMRQITTDAPLAELIIALQTKPIPLTRQLVCDILGERAADPMINSAIPTLLKALRDPIGATRQCAAWSLGELKASEAKNALQHALEQESDPYAAEVMRKALKAIRQTQAT